jgi:Putative metal-binding motif/Abnormal spindle-like microcephaly-assoc'd, ASPM-SPD-2-Hydin
MRTPFLLFLVACGSQTSVTKTAKELNVTPTFADLGTVAVGDVVTEEIKLTHLQGEAIQVVDVRLQNIDGSFFSTDESLQITVEQNATEVLTVSYSPTEAGFHRATLSISTDEERTPVHEVDLRGSAVLPIADVSPGLLDFGPVAGGDYAERSVRLSNLGSVPMAFLGASFSNPAFSGGLAATTVDPGSSVDLSIRFDATDESRVLGTLQLDLGPTPVGVVSLRANSCEDGDAELYDQDGDGTTSCGGDCADTDPEVHPGVAESCDGVDSDCDGRVDEGTTCADDDSDGQTEDQGDCNDANADIFQGAPEDLGNGIDDDCDGVTDGGGSDLDGDGYTTGAGDCDDTNAAYHPGATEVADARDNNCDGRVDEGTAVYDDDGDGYNERAGDCDDTNAAVSPGAAEQADRLDNNCNGQVDEGASLFDDDGDGFSEVGGDCDDANAGISPAALETVGDGIDGDCDGVVE